MDFHEYLDQYCERVSPGLLAEPLNLFSNLSFIVAGCLALRVLAAHTSRAGSVLVGFLFAIGVGSALFHSFATRWAELADVIPIIAFLLYYFYFTLRRVLALSPGQTALGFSGFFALSALCFLLPADVFNQSNQYFGAVLTLLGLGLYARHRQLACGRTQVACFFGFCLALFFRTVDPRICADFPHGTHFLWHLSNGVLLYFLVASALRATPPAGLATRPPDPAQPASAR